MIRVDVVQGSLEWLSARAGIPTASNFDKLVTTTGAPSKQREKYMYQLAGEYVSKAKMETYQSEAMKRGVELEEEARALYEVVKGVEVEQIGFCLTDDKKAGCSPDGFIQKDGLAEFKCPLVYAAVGYLLDEKSLVTEYLQQIQGQMFVTGRKWCDVMSYFPGLRPVIVRVTRDEVFIRKLAIEIEVFSEQLNKIIERIK